MSQNNKNKNQVVFCIECNEGNNISYNLKCPQCSAAETDSYYYLDRGIIFLSLILCKNQAFRHVILNRCRDNTLIYSLILVILYIFMDFVYNFLQENNLNLALFASKSVNSESFLNLVNYAYINEKFWLEVTQISLDFGFIFGSIYFFYSEKIKKQRLSFFQILFSISLGQITRLVQILLIIWNYHNSYVIACILSIRCCQVASVRAIFETQSQWILAIITVACAYFLQYSILWMLNLEHLNKDF